MCVRYTPPEPKAIEREWLTAIQFPWRARELHPRGQGPFLRAANKKNSGGNGRQREAILGRWGLIPPFATTADPAFSTHNARHESVAGKPAFRDAWADGQRCLIPAQSFLEPCWESGRNVWWRFQRSDGAPWGLAGLWGEWIDPASGERRASYTMLTINADTHPLMSRMHKPDPALASDRQDKRSVIAIERGDVERWLYGSEADVEALIRAPGMDVTEGMAEPDDMPTTLPLF